VHRGAARWHRTSARKKILSKGRELLSIWSADASWNGAKRLKRRRLPYWVLWRQDQVCGGEGDFGENSRSCPYCKFTWTWDSRHVKQVFHQLKTERNAGGSIIAVNLGRLSVRGGEMIDARVESCWGLRNTRAYRWVLRNTEPHVCITEVPHKSRSRTKDGATTRINRKLINYKSITTL